MKRMLQNINLLLQHGAETNVKIRNENIEYSLLAYIKFRDTHYQLDYDSEPIIALLKKYGGKE